MATDTDMISLTPSASAPSATTRALRHCSSCTCHHTIDTTIEPDPPVAAVSLDLEISHLEDVVAENIRSLVLLKRRRNEGLPVSHVPPEVLSEVFLYCRGDIVTDSETYIKRLSWIQILHVSSHWRAVAFTSPRLWNALDLRFPRLVELFGAHCGALPLSVMLSTGRNGQGRQLPAAHHISDVSVNALRRVNNPIVDVRLYGDYEELHSCLRYILPRASQDVRMLGVSVSLQSREWEPIEILDKASLPQLQTLCLTYLSLSSESVLLQGCARSLRELKLVECYMNTGIGVLGISSCLEKLYIDTSVFEVAENEGETVLPALKVLTLKDDISGCTGILNCLKITSSCHVTIFPDDDDSDSENLNGLMACISGSTQSPSGLDVNVNFSKELLTIQRENHTVILDLRHWDTRSKVFSAASAILAPVTTVLALSCEEDSSELTQDGLLTLVRDTSIIDLNIGGRGTFLDALAICMDLPDSFLPGLAQLHISDADFTQLSEEAKQCWSHGVAARRGVLVDIHTVDCIGVPPAPLES